MPTNQNYSHRTTTKTLHITDSLNKPLIGVPVSVNQTNHQFLFACGAFQAVSAANPDLTHEGEERLPAEEFMELWLTLFNAGTLPFYWLRFEPEQGKPRTKELMNAAKWLKDRGCVVKGHPLCWHTSTAPWLLDMNNKDILQAQIDRIHRDVSDFKGVIDMWDVINEVVIMPIFDKYDNGITRIAKELGRIGIIRKMFEAVRDVNPEATLLLNDFNTSISYEILIEGCLEAGIPIDAIGIQSHQHQGFWGREKLEEVLERYERFGLPIHFTENTLISGDLMPKHIVDLNDFVVDEWPSTEEGELRQAKEVEIMYRTLFAHPLVEAITTWSFADDMWLHAPAGFLRKDNSKKPSYDILKSMIKDEWWTSKDFVTDSNGNIELTGFLGEYEVKHKDQTAAFKLDKSKEDTVSIQLNF
ncbi:MAG: endo-1,4-beta-xylanase [Lachnoclostridium sp.]|jgi:GH35 family endo-1,4-beta-xylanase|nr:endo-1,4-beta-xylanase [Lachnoclostridium sp.]